MVDAYIFTVSEEQAGERIDRFLCDSISDLTRSAVQRIIEEGGVQVGFLAVTKNYKLRAGDRITVQVPETRELEVLPQEIPLDVRYEDDDLLVVNKPKGMVVHPAPGNPDGTLVNALLWHCRGSLSGINGVIRPGIVHRIDKDTSGLLIVAKNDFAHLSLAQQIQAHSFSREYRTVVYGRFQTESGTVDAPIGRDSADRKKMAVTQKNSKPAVTHFLPRFHAPACAAGNGPHPPDPRPHGLYRTSRGGRPRLRPEKGHHVPSRPVPARGAHRLSASPHKAKNRDR